MPEQISQDIETTLKALRCRGLDARFAENRQVARKIIVNLVQENWIVGCGDSTTYILADLFWHAYLLKYFF